MVATSARLLRNFARKSSDFVQAAPVLANPFTCDVTLQRYLQRKIQDNTVYVAVAGDLQRFGDRIVTEIDELGWRCELDPPKLINFDSWGNRIDQLHMSEAWKAQKRISAEEGLVAIGYEREKFGGFHRLYQYAKLFLYSSSSGLYSCPLAMTDGAAKVIRELNTRNQSSGICPADVAFARLTTRDYGKFWTSGQWMTERRGGSDVAGGTETTAVPDTENQGVYHLYGRKWFSSAVDADIALALARHVDNDGNIVQGTRGLSLFILPIRNKSDGSLNQIEVVRLKDKLGTRQLPTAELVLNGSRAEMLGAPFRGVANISHMLNVTRLHNAIASVAAMKRITQLAIDFAGKRSAFGRPVISWPLHARTLSQMSLVTRGCTLFTFHAVDALGKAECDCEFSEHELRLLTPLVKMFTAKMAMSVVSEGLECFGGQGYMEDTRLPLILRDAQVTPIWEGTTNVLALDVLRAMRKNNGQSLLAVQKGVQKRLRKGAESRRKHELKSSLDAVKCAMDLLMQFDVGKAPSAARDYSFGLAKAIIGSLLIKEASYSSSSGLEVFAAKRWCETGNLATVKSVDHYCNEMNEMSMELLLENENSGCA